MGSIHVISRHTIPRIEEVVHDGEVHRLGELRDFRWDEHLREFMSTATDFSVSWVRLLDGEVLQTHVHPIGSMMIIHSGSGEMLGALKRPVAEGDVIFVPAGSQHGFVGGRDGLYALSIQFGEGLYTVPEKPRVHFTSGDDDLAGVLAYNEERLKAYVERPLSCLFASRVLQDPLRRNGHLEALQMWWDRIQRSRLTSQAAGGDRRHPPIVLHQRSAGGLAATELSARDAVMEAVTSWFAYQMYVLDGAEKVALVHLVIEGAMAAYEERATPGKCGENQSLGRRAADDAVRRAAIGDALLRSESPRTYARLKEILCEAWDMIVAMTDRMTELTAADRPGSFLAPVSTSTPLSSSVGS